MGGLRSSPRLAIVALLAQTVAFVLLPGLHMTGHRPDHRHGPQGIVPASHGHPHPHPDEGPAPAPHEHGGGAAAHLEAAALDVPAFVLAPPCAPTRAAPPPALRGLTVAEPPPRHAAPRGPPAPAVPSTPILV